MLYAMQADKLAIKRIKEDKEIIKNTYKVETEEEIYDELNKKIKEELFEYLESSEIEELADLEEVLRAILDVKKCSFEEFGKR